MSTSNCTSRTSTGEYTCLNVDVWFSRNFFRYWNTIFVPSILIHVLSWVAFWFGSNGSKDKDSKGEHSENGKPKHCKKSKNKKRFVISLTAFVLMTWFVVTISPIDAPDGYTCNRKSMWSGFSLFMTFASFLHVCCLENGLECPFRGKKCDAKCDDAENIPLKVVIVVNFSLIN